MKRKLQKILLVAVLIACGCLMVDVLRFPECYISTWRYQLKNDIERGDEVAIEYYNHVYVENDRILFEN